MSQKEARIRSVTVYLPGGDGVEIPGERALVGVMPNGLPFVEEMLEDGAKRRYLGLPHSLVLEPPPLVEPALVLPGRRS